MQEVHTKLNPDLYGTSIIQQQKIFSPANWTYTRQEEVS